MKFHAKGWAVTAAAALVLSAASTALAIESNATLYSVRPHQKESPSGVIFTADGSVTLPVV